MNDVKKAFEAYDFSNTFYLLDVDGNDLKEIKTVEDIPDLLHLHQGFNLKCPEG